MEKESGTICPNQPYGLHIRVRCAGCGSTHTTKNIGARDAVTNQVYCARSLFDIIPCTCADPLEFPVTHICERDDPKD